MKKILFFSIFVFFQAAVVLGQECGTYYLFKEGSSMELTSYDKNGKNSSKVIYNISEVSGGSDNATATVNMEMFDKKNEPVATSEFLVTCTGDGVHIDATYLVSPQMFESYRNVDFTVTGDNLQYPNSLSSGQTLPDANANISVEISPIVMKFYVNVTNRRVEGKETVTTPAGTFDCFVLRYDAETKMGVKIRASGKQWLAPNIGVVKDESYNNKGKLLGYTELTAYNP